MAGTGLETAENEVKSGVWQLSEWNFPCQRKKG
jgi:hypothetical protein